MQLNSCRTLHKIVKWKTERIEPREAGEVRSLEVFSMPASSIDRELLPLDMKRASEHTLKLSWQRCACPVTVEGVTFEFVGKSFGKNRRKFS